ncbi:MAG: type I-E CRISPR-associated protein Cse2/CasB [Chloroflexi bacterium]|nr:type I-E CRISPR-associated protein Cse2/CasB [Chloroflexota bacterium]
MKANAPEVEYPAGLPQEPERRSWGDTAFALAGEVAGRRLSPGDRAELRRMDPDSPGPAVYWRLMAEHDLLGNRALERKWALILHGIALMTPRIGVDGVPQSAHNGSTPVGRALFLGGEAQREKGFYSESRLNRLLTARGGMLRTLLARAFRTLASAGVSFNWREMAQFILSEGYDEEAAERARRRIASEYYRAERRSAPVSEN